ncbi:hypothetical protein J4447_01310 [Candidatus Pacearchaeota archaeon]|nr:hypothetical protein [Candidatus Pacearchaeota archaeon]
MESTLEIGVEKDSDSFSHSNIRSRVMTRVFDTPIIKIGESSASSILLGGLLTPFPLLVATYVIGKLAKIPEGFVREYGWNAISAFGGTLAFRNPKVSKSLLKPALAVTVLTYALEVSEHLGLYAKIFDSQYADWNMPGDFIAYAAGAAAAVGLDKILRRKGK